MAQCLSFSSNALCILPPAAGFSQTAAFSQDLSRRERSLTVSNRYTQGQRSPAQVCTGTPGPLVTHFNHNVKYHKEKEEDGAYE